MAKNKEIGCLFAIGLLVFGLIAYSGLNVLADWLESQPWYVDTLIGGLAIYTIYKIGEYFDWWG